MIPTVWSRLRKAKTGQLQLSFLYSNGEDELELRIVVGSVPARAARDVLYRAAETYLMRSMYYAAPETRPLLAELWADEWAKKPPQLAMLKAVTDPIAKETP